MRRGFRYRGRLYPVGGEAPAEESFVAYLLRRGERAGEEGGVFDGRGRLVAYRVSPTDCLPWSVDQLGLMRDAHVIHSHPTAHAFSAPDISITVATDRAKTTLVTAAGTVITLFRPDTGWVGRDGRPITPGDAVGIWSFGYVLGLRDPSDDDPDEVTPPDLMALSVRASFLALRSLEDQTGWRHTTRQGPSRA